MTIITVGVFLAIATPPAQTKAPAPVSISVVLSAVRDATLPAADRDRLVGKTYAGAIVVRAVRLSTDGSALVDAEAVEETPGRSTVVLRFAFPPDDPALAALQPNQPIKIRATLTKIVLTGRLPTLQFSDFVLDPSRN